MGLYIEQLKDGTHLTPRNKAQQLVGDGARELTGLEIMYQPNLVCVVRNPNFDAAGYVYSEREFQRFLRGVDPRDIRWFVYEGSPDIAQFDRSLAMDG